MAATAEQVARLRRMTGENASTTYSDDELIAYIERFPVEDARGEAPLIESTTLPATLIANPDWSPVYDLAAVAAEIWTEKAAQVAQDYGFTTIGGTYNRQQVHDQYMKMARMYRSQRNPKTITLRPEPLLQGREVIYQDEFGE